MKKIMAACVAALMTGTLLTGCNNTGGCTDDYLTSSVTEGKGGGKTRSKMRTGKSKPNSHSRSKHRSLHDDLFCDD